MKVKSLKLAAIAGALAAVATAAYAGGFYLAVSAPDPADARMKGAVLVFRALGCHGPGSGVSATAEGIVNGKRKSIALKLKPLGNDTYIANRQWPKEGRWVVAATAASIAKGPDGGPLRITTGGVVELTDSGTVMTTQSKQDRTVVVVRRPDRETLAQLVEKTLKSYESRRAGL